MCMGTCSTIENPVYRRIWAHLVFDKGPYSDWRLKLAQTRARRREVMLEECLTE